MKKADKHINKPLRKILLGKTDKNLDKLDLI